ncbi:maltose/moltooligosaccharide transporter [Balneicella halophila]|uniref:Maltose/moltooligosaccharide transporter n=1 Tax=Balneicella halophila TaxID=1537566 RepID=A0A7L4UQI4_BALHA|nr:MFS transporter [Balneicella halophila]PVX51772.1 maltose/moltooligosaccharide transporter [Balneicella halophila]
METKQLREKPHLSFWQIWNMSFGFLGIQMGFALQNANVSRIFQTLGARIEDIPILWVAAPLTGLIIQPIIGYLSDKTWHPRWGRRRPYFLVGAILASAALFVMPNSPVLWFAAGMLWIMDASINVSMEPFRAFVGDKLPDEQRTKGFAMQSFFIGIGAYIASYLPQFLTWLGVANTAPEGVVPDSVKYSFYIGGAVFLITVLWTVLTSKEYSPEELEQFIDEHKEEFQKEEHSKEWYLKNGTKHLTTGIVVLAIGLISSYFIYSYNLKKDLFVLTLGLISSGAVVMIISGWLQKQLKYKSSFVTIVNDFQTMPKIMIQLAWVQFFSWFALFSMWIYMTPAVTEHIYGTTDTTSEAYNIGANQVGEMFANYNIIAAAVAFLLPVVARWTSRKFTHFLALTIGGFGLMSVYFINEPSTFMMEWLPMIGVGVAWASILSIPYAMLSGALPSSKMGYYMGVFNFFIVIPQLVAASILGFLVSQFFNNEPVYALLVGGCSMILGGILSLFVNDSLSKQSN